VHRAKINKGIERRLLNDWDVRFRIVAANPTETVFTSQITVLDPDTAIKLSLLLRAPKAMSGGIRTLDPK
jgi:hypothetical protein